MGGCETASTYLLIYLMISELTQELSGRDERRALDACCCLRIYKNAAAKFKIV